MRHGRRVADQGAHVPDVGHELEQLQSVDERADGLGAGGQVKGEHRAGAVREVPLGEGGAGVSGDRRVVDAPDGGVPGQVLGDRSRGLLLPGDADAEGLQALDELGGAGRGEGGAEVVQELAARQRQVGAAAVPVDECLSAVAGLGPGQLGPPLRGCAVVEGAAVHDRPAEDGPVPADELRGGVHHHVGTMFQWPVQDRRRQGAVHHDRDPGGVGDVRQRRQVRHGGQRVGDGLQEERAGVRPDRRAPGLRVGRIGESDLDAEVGEGVRQQVHRPAVELAGGDQVLTAVEQGQQRQRDGGLSRGGADGPDPALQGRKSVLEHGDRGVARAAVGEPGGLQPEH